jgi:membrane-bound acyltransferase YfiQ involved in biofilm formation
MKIKIPTGSRVKATIRTSQIITAAMMVGVTVFGIVAAVMAAKGPPKAPMLAYVGVLMAVQIVALRFFIPGLFLKTQLKSVKHSEAELVSERLPNLYLTQLIIGLALLEGSAFFNLVAYLMEGQWFSLGIAGAMLALMAMMFPTTNKFESWAEELSQNLNSAF